MNPRSGAAEADPTPPPSSPEEQLIARLIVEFRLSVAEQLRLYELRAALGRHGIGPADRGFARWLSPVFCGSPEEQTLFLARFEELRAEVIPERSPAAVWQRVVAPARAGRPAAPAPSPKPAPEIDEVARRNRRNLLVLGLVGSAASAAFGLLLILIGGRQLPLPGTAPPTPSSPASDVTTRIEQFAAGWGLKLDLGPWALLGLIPLLIGLALSALLILKLRREQREFRPTPEASRAIALRATLGDYFGSQDVLRSMLNLARHRLAPGLRLHIRRSLRATVRNAGFPTLRYGARPTVPGYLLLLDRRSPRDHLPLVGEMLARRLRQQYATVTRYSFNRRPGLPVNLDDPEGRLASFIELTAMLADAKALVLAETDLLLRPSGQPADWLGELAGAGHVTILDPRAESDWAGDESALQRAGFAVLPATPDGIRRYADWLAVGGGAPAAAPPKPARLDLPFQLSRHRALLLSPEPLGEDLLTGLLRDLQVWLGDDLMRLLSALAVFPRLEPPFTLTLGKALRTDRGLPLLNDDTLLDIVRLPWLRAGRMPYYLRERLAREMSPKDLRTTVRMVHAFLVSKADTLRDGAARPPKRPDLLVHWLRQSDDSDLHDPLLIDAVEGRRPDKLGTEPDAGLGVRLRRAAGDPAAVTAAIAIAAAAVTMWAQPLEEDRRVPIDAAPPQKTTPPKDTPDPQPNLPTKVDPKVLPADLPADPPPAEPRRDQLRIAQDLGESALQRLYRLQEGEGTVYQNALEGLKAAMAEGDVDEIRRIDAQTQSQMDFYEQERLEDEIAKGQNQEFILFFDYNMSKITEPSAAVLRRIADYRGEDVLRAQVVGYFDYAARPPERPGMAQRRAEAVTAVLARGGIPRRAILVETAPTRPLVPTAEGVREPQNRRVEITITVRGAAAAAE